jgi:hypothetical protein
MRTILLVFVSLLELASSLLLTPVCQFAPCIKQRRVINRAPLQITIRCRHEGRKQLQQRQRSTSSLCMVRNIDLVEALIFYGEDSLFQGDDELLSGVEYLVDECRRDETAVLAILPPSAQNHHPALPKAIHVHTETQAPPNPRDLWEAIHSVEVHPKGFGGSSGFGRKAADPERPPVPKHCVALCHTEDQCRAARYVGMRVLCLTDNALADAVMMDDCWESICMDDIATPGSFWLNPPHPRDDDGNGIDIEAVIDAYENENEDEDGSGGPRALAKDDNGELDDDQLRAMLADIDPL